MLILGRGINERVIIDNGRIIVHVVGVNHGRVRLGIIAPDGVTVDREEIHLAKRADEGGNDAKA